MPPNHAERVINKFQQHQVASHLTSAGRQDSDRQKVLCCFRDPHRSPAPVEHAVSRGACSSCGIPQPHSPLPSVLVAVKLCDVLVPLIYSLLPRLFTIAGDGLRHFIVLWALSTAALNSHSSNSGFRLRRAISFAVFSLDSKSRGGVPAYSPDTIIS